MKLILLTIILLTLICGCSQKPDPRIAQQQEQIADLSRRLDKQEQNHRELVDLVAAQFDKLAQLSTNMMSAASLVLTMTNQMNRVEPRLNQYVAAQQRAAAGLSNGVPVAVYNRIFAEARHRYPTDYEMQETIVRWQIEAYQKLHGR